MYIWIYTCISIAHRIIYMKICLRVYTYIFIHIYTYKARCAHASKFSRPPRVEPRASPASRLWYPVIVSAFRSFYIYLEIFFYLLCQRSHFVHVRRWFLLETWLSIFDFILSVTWFEICQIKRFFLVLIIIDNSFIAHAVLYLYLFALMIRKETMKLEKFSQTFSHFFAITCYV